MLGGNYLGEAYLGQAYAGTTGPVTDTGSATASLGNLTAAATGHKTTADTATASIGGLTATASGVHTAHGTATASLGALAATSSGVRADQGTATASLGGLTAAAVEASRYETQVLIDAPAFYYRLGESTGTVAADATAHALNGTYVGSPVLGVTGLLSGDTNTAVNFDAVGHDLTRAYNSAMDSASDYTVEAWVKTTITAGFFYTIAQGGALCQLYWDSSGILHWAVDDTTSTAHLVSYTPSTHDGVRHHIVGVKSGNTATLYVDGVQVATSTFSSLRSPTAAAPSWVFASSGSGAFGVLDEVAYYPAALSSTRVAAHYTAGSGASTISGTATASLGGFTATAVATRTASGTATASLGAVTAATAGIRTAHGTATASLGNLGGLATGAGAGILSASLGALTAAISGSRTTPGIAMADLGAFIAAAIAAGPITAPTAGPMQFAFRMLAPTAALIPVEAGLDFIEWGFIMLQPGDALIGDPA